MTIPTRKEAIQKIEGLLQSFKQSFSAIQLPQKFDDITLDDDSVVQVDVFAVDGKVTKDGLPVADGSYMLKDGSKIEVVMGIITSIEAPTAAAADPLAPAQPELKTPEQIQAAAQKFAVATPEQQQAMLVALMDYCFGWQIKKESEEAKMKEAIDAYKSVVGGQQAAIEQASQVMQQTFEMVKEIGMEEVAAPIVQPEAMTAFQEFQAKKKNI